MNANWVTDLGGKRRSTSIADVAFRTKFGTYLFIQTCSQVCTGKGNSQKFASFQEERIGG